MKHPIRRRLMYLAFQGLHTLVSWLPLSVSRAIGRALGGLAYVCLARERRLANAHLTFALPGLTAGERHRIARQAFQGIGQTAAEWLSPTCWDPKHIQAMVRCEGFEHLQRAQDAGNGAIVVTPHFGNWELMAPYGKLRGLSPTVLARRLRYPEYESFLVNLRGSCGVPTLARGNLKDVAKALRDNQFVGVLPDQDIDSLEGIFVDFFGRPAHTLVGPAALSVMTGAPVIPCFMIRDGESYRFVIHPPLSVSPGADRQQAVAELTRGWSEVFESVIRLHPEQWVWMHRRWRTQQSGAASRPVPQAGDEPAAGVQPSLAIFLGLACCLSLVAGLTGCGRAEDKAPADQAGQAAPPPPDDSNANQEMSGFTLTGYQDDGSKSWQLNGQGATVEDSTVTIVKPDGIGYSPERTAYLTAGGAQVNQTNRHIRLEQEVTVHTSDGLWLTAPILHWNPDEKHVATDTPVRIETDHMLLRGRGFSGDAALKDATIETDIEMVLNPSDHEPVGLGRRQVTITCDGPLNFDYGNSIATFEDNVHVQDPNGDLYSDKLVAHLDQASHTIKYAEATGRVRIQQQQNTALSEKALYEPGIGKITLLGKPSLLLYPTDNGGAASAASFGGLVTAPAAAGTEPEAKTR